jgi:hypothetical protein
MSQCSESVGQWFQAHSECPGHHASCDLDQVPDHAAVRVCLRAAFAYDQKTVKQDYSYSSHTSQTVIAATRMSLVGRLVGTV